MNFLRVPRAEGAGQWVPKAASPGQCPGAPCSRFCYGPPAVGCRVPVVAGPQTKVTGP